MRDHEMIEKLEATLRQSSGHVHVAGADRAPEGRGSRAAADGWVERAAPGTGVEFGATKRLPLNDRLAFLTQRSPHRTTGTE